MTILTKNQQLSVGDSIIPIQKFSDSRLADDIYFYLTTNPYQFNVIRDDIVAGKSLSESYKDHAITSIYPSPSFVAPIKWHIFNYQEFDILTRTWIYPDLDASWLYPQIQKVFDEWYDGVAATGINGRLQIAPGVIVPKFYEQLCITTAKFRDFKTLTDAFISCKCSDIIPNSDILDCLDEYITGTSASFYSIYKTCKLQEEQKTEADEEPPPSSEGTKNVIESGLLTSKNLIYAVIILGLLFIMKK